MKVLVTGATGFIGFHVAWALLRAGEAVRLVVRRPAPAELVRQGAEVWTADLRDPQALKGCMEGVDAVVHVAGQLRGWRFRDFYEGNVKTTRNLLQEARRASELRRFVYFSSLAAQGPLDPRTGQPRGPVSHYGRSKRLAEQEVQRALPPSQWVILRPGVVYGPRDRALLPYFRWALRMPVLPAPPRPRRLGLVYVEDLVAFTLWALRNPAARGRTFCITGPESPSVADLFRRIGKAAGRPPRILRVPALLLVTMAGAVVPAFPLGLAPPWINPDKLREARQQDWRCFRPLAWSRTSGLSPTDLARGFQKTLESYRRAGWL